MRLNLGNIKEVMSKNVVDLSKEELLALGLILDIKFACIYKRKTQMYFVLHHQGTRIIVEAEKYTCLLMGIKKNQCFRQSKTTLTPFTECYTFIDMVSAVRKHFIIGYSLPVTSRELLREYGKYNFQMLVYVANDLITQPQTYIKPQILQTA